MRSSAAFFGIALALCSGVLLGTFALPMKTTRGWRWENTWLVYCFCGLIACTWLLAFATVPNLLGILTQAPRSTLGAVFLYGAGWGIGCVLFGLALDLSGLALGTAIVLGTNNALGALLPLVLFDPHQLQTRAGLTLSTGVGAMLVGVGLCAWAGAASNTGDDELQRGDRRGVFLAIAAGVFATMFNFALIAGTPLQRIAEAQGVKAVSANNPIWCVSLLGGFAVNASYCVYLLFRNSSWSLFRSRPMASNWSRAALMGGLWMAGVAIYGSAVSQLGSLGASIGWALIQSTAVAAGNTAGIFLGEWRSKGRRFRQIMPFGLLTLFAGIGIISYSAFL